MDEERERDLEAIDELQAESESALGPDEGQEDDQEGESKATGSPPAPDTVSDAPSWDTND